MILALLLLAQPPCALCHKAQAEGHRNTPMARTLAQPSARQAPLVFSEGGFTYTIGADGTGYAVADSTGQRVTARLAWALGAGSIGQTFLFERNGAWHETAVSYYSSTGKLDWTPGHAERSRRTLDEAVGRRLEPAESAKCFGCHSTPAAGSFRPGVQCEACHQSSAGTHPPNAMAKLGAMTPEDLAGFCSKCHPSWAEIAESGPRGVGNVRHQIYRLTASKCYDTNDRRIACTACHDPHQSKARPAAFFDAKCGACHTACKAGNRSGCVNCHMPKISPPGLHASFTDHRIRVVRPGEKYPD